MSFSLNDSKHMPDIVNHLKSAFCENTCLSTAKKVSGFESKWSASEGFIRWVRG